MVVGRGGFTKDDINCLPVLQETRGQVVGWWCVGSWSEGPWSQWSRGESSQRSTQPGVTVSPGSNFRHRNPRVVQLSSGHTPPKYAKQHMQVPVLQPERNTSPAKFSSNSTSSRMRTLAPRNPLHSLCLLCLPSSATPATHGLPAATAVAASPTSPTHRLEKCLLSFILSHEVRAVGGSGPTSLSPSLTCHPLAISAKSAQQHQVDRFFNAHTCTQEKSEECASPNGGANGEPRPVGTPCAKVEPPCEALGNKINQRREGLGVPPSGLSNSSQWAVPG